MPDSGKGKFVGPMPPQLFLGEFMKTMTPLPTTPKIDLSQIPRGSIQDMCGPFVRLSSGVAYIMLISAVL